MTLSTSNAPITTLEHLQAVVARLDSAPILAVDTEFMREKTYYSKLCLIQIAAHLDGKDEVFLIDPLLNKLDLRPLAKLWSNPNITKVFHAGAQDLQILFDECGAAPRPYFDTQDAATLIGQPEQIGYGPLVYKLLDVKLGKADSFTDWARRPLSDNQLKYAGEDVSYLLKMYPIITAELEAGGRQNWLTAEFTRRSSDKALTIEPREQFRRLKRIASLKPRQLAIAREVAAWRENEAMRKNLPKRWLLSDEAILEIVRREPQTEDELRNLRGVGANLKYSLRKIVQAVAEGQACPQENWPQLVQRPRLSGEDNAAIELMAAIVKKRAAQHRLSSSVLASRYMIEDYLAARHTDRADECALMQGWRKELIGEELSKLLAGEICLSFQDGNMIIDSCNPKKMTGEKDAAHA